MEVVNNLTNLLRQKLNAEKELHSVECQFQESVKLIKARIAECERLIQLDNHGLNLEKITQARALLYLRGKFIEGGVDRQSVVDDVIKQLVGHPPRTIYNDIQRNYLGTKNYAEWRGQRCDCEYGMAPRHGHICFAVGLDSNVRERGGIITMSPDEIEACVYYMTNIERIEFAEAEAKKSGN